MFGAGTAALTNRSGYAAQRSADFLPLSAALMKIRSPAERLINSLLSLKVEHGQFPHYRPEFVRLLLSFRLKRHLIISTNTVAFVIGDFFFFLSLGVVLFKGANLKIMTNEITPKHIQVLFSFPQSIIIWDKQNFKCPQTHPENQGKLETKGLNAARSLLNTNGFYVLRRM